MVINLTSQNKPQACSGNQVNPGGLSTTLAAAGTGGVMTRLVIGMSVCTGLGTKALAISEHGG